MAGVRSHLFVVVLRRDFECALCQIASGLWPCALSCFTTATFLGSWWNRGLGMHSPFECARYWISVDGFLCLFLVHGKFGGGFYHDSSTDGEGGLMRYEDIHMVTYEVCED